jgi:hypothetical protein
MARHPSSSSWPQLTTRASVSGQSSTARVSRRSHRAGGSEHDHTIHCGGSTSNPRGRTAPEHTACGKESRSEFQVGVTWRRT